MLWIPRLRYHIHSDQALEAPNFEWFQSLPNTTSVIFFVLPCGLFSTPLSSCLKDFWPKSVLQVSPRVCYDFCPPSFIFLSQNHWKRKKYIWYLQNHSQPQNFHEFYRNEHDMKRGLVPLRTYNFRNMMNVRELIYLKRKHTQCTGFIVHVKRIMFSKKFRNRTCLR